MPEHSQCRHHRELDTAGGWLACADGKPDPHTIYRPRGRLSVPEIAAGESTDVACAGPTEVPLGQYVLRLRLYPVSSRWRPMLCGSRLAGRSEERMDVFYWGG